MSEINVVSRTQIINVEPTTSAVSVINAGPPGPGGAIGSATGSVILPGTTPPLPSDGAVGNYWLDKTADILYGPKKSVAPVWDIALYGAQTPPQLLGENRITTNPPFSSNLLPVNINLDMDTRLQIYFSLNFNVQAGAQYAIECRIDNSVVGRFGFPYNVGGQFCNGRVFVPDVTMGPHTISAYPLRVFGTGNFGFNVIPSLPAYLSVYKDMP